MPWNGNRRRLLQSVAVGSAATIGVGPANATFNKNQAHKYEGIVYDPVTREVTGNAKMTRDRGKDGLKGTLKISGTEIASDTVNIKLDEPNPSSVKSNKGVAKANNGVRHNEYLIEEHENDLDRKGGITVNEAGNINIDKDDRLKMDITSTTDISLSGMIKSKWGSKKDAFILSPRNSDLELDKDASKLSEAMKFGNRGDE
ncbi:hypothetical protein [Natrinema sp. SYSU A 869]|uniref:hypothetical protein n=1 Tax=Natrinema sp. SYSU A 869 TaxID=2871694 RepID=UPI001CA3F18B|nr:hypothetical protein [Natrinema sp. SYSU A 869]